MSLTNLLVPSYTNMLNALSRWLDKAQAQMPGAAADQLMSARLAPDMFPLSTQIRFACVQAYESVSRLTGSAFPPLIGELRNEGRNADARPGSIADAQARIRDTIAFLDKLTPGALDAEPGSPLAHELPQGMVFDFTAEQYARDWALAQFYFHVMAAYSILRAQGVAIGKADYIPHLVQHLRANSD